MTQLVCLLLLSLAFAIAFEVNIADDTGIALPSSNVEEGEWVTIYAYLTAGRKVLVQWTQTAGATIQWPFATDRREWRSKFQMPRGNVTLRAETASVGVNWINGKFNGAQQLALGDGSTITVNNIDYKLCLPASPPRRLGLVVYFHSSGTSAEQLRTYADNEYNTYKLASLGFAVGAFDATERAKNDGSLFGDDVIRWCTQLRTPDGNPDLVNLERFIAMFHESNPEYSTLPVFTMGFSSGGSMAQIARLDSLLSNRVVAGVGMCGGATARWRSRVPFGVNLALAQFSCERDTRGGNEGYEEDDGSSLVSSLLLLAQMQNATSVLIRKKYESVVSPDVFRFINGITAAESEVLAADLAAFAMAPPQPLLTELSSKPYLRVIDPNQTLELNDYIRYNDRLFPAWAALSYGESLAARGFVNSLRGHHSPSSFYTSAMVNFFYEMLNFNSTTTTPTTSSTSSSSTSSSSSSSSSSFSSSSSTSTSSLLTTSSNTNDNSFNTINSDSPNNSLNYVVAAGVALCLLVTISSVVAYVIASRRTKKQSKRATTTSMSNRSTSSMRKRRRGAGSEASSGAQRSAVRSRAMTRATPSSSFRQQQPSPPPHEFYQSLPASNVSNPLFSTPNNYVNVDTYY